MACTSRKFITTDDLSSSHFACSGGQLVTQCVCDLDDVMANGTVEGDGVYEVQVTGGVATLVTPSPAYQVCETVVVPVGTSGQITLPFANTYVVPPSIQETRNPAGSERIVLWYIDITTTGVTVDVSDTTTEPITLTVCGGNAAGGLPFTDVIPGTPATALTTIDDGTDSVVVGPPPTDNGDGTFTFTDTAGNTFVLALPSDEQAGIEPIAVSATGGSVTFATAFTSSPKVNISLQQDGADPILIAAATTITTAGFSFILSDAAPTGNYSLHWDAQTV